MSLAPRDDASARDLISTEGGRRFDAYAGVDLSLGGGNALLPFVQYQRSSLRDRSSDPAVTKRSPDKLGIGAIASVALGEFDTVDIAPLYVVDYEQHSRVISIKADWIPDFLRQIDGMGVLGSYPLVRGLLVFRLTPRVLFQGSHVLDAGDNVELRQSVDYSAREAT